MFIRLNSLSSLSSLTLTLLCDYTFASLIHFEIGRSIMLHICVLIVA